MKERPILFNGPNVRAILEGRKTQTRRPVIGMPQDHVLCGSRTFVRHGAEWHFPKCIETDNVPAAVLKSPFGKPGDRLWVRECFSGEWFFDYYKTKPSLWDKSSPIWYWADGGPEYGDWTRPKPSIHMPRWAGRITLEIKRVWVERLQEIDEGGAVAEGRMCVGVGDDWAREGSFKLGWNTVYAKKGHDWDKNPWVWCCEFEVTK